VNCTVRGFGVVDTAVVEVDVDAGVVLEVDVVVVDTICGGVCVDIDDDVDRGAAELDTVDAETADDGAEVTSGSCDDADEENDAVLIILNTLAVLVGDSVVDDDIAVETMLAADVDGVKEVATTVVEDTVDRGTMLVGGCVDVNEGMEVATTVVEDSADTGTMLVGDCVDDDEDNEVAMTGVEDTVDRGTVLVGGCVDVNEGMEVATTVAEDSADTGAMLVGDCVDDDDDKEVAMTGVEDTVDSGIVLVGGCVDVNEGMEVATTVVEDSADTGAMLVGDCVDEDGDKEVALTVVDESVDTGAVLIGNCAVIVDAAVDKKSADVNGTRIVVNTLVGVKGMDVVGTALVTEEVDVVGTVLMSVVVVEEGITVVNGIVDEDDVSSLVNPGADEEITICALVAVDWPDDGTGVEDTLVAEAAAAVETKVAEGIVVKPSVLSVTPTFAVVWRFVEEATDCVLGEMTVVGGMDVEATSSLEETNVCTLVGLLGVDRSDIETPGTVVDMVVTNGTLIAAVVEEDTVCELT
jgi:hypothetical protein